jgi:O-methyltransferase involved in polyketide biosynthesis
MSETPRRDLISLTAWSVAERRTFTDIPLAPEIFAEIEAMLGASGGPTLPRLRADDEHTPYFEARYKLTNRLLADMGIRQVLELAAGFSPRGIVLTADPSLRYVELDLGDVAARKRAMLRRLVDRGIVGARSNLHIEEGNVVEDGTLSRASRHFAEAPVAVINEGLLRYLGFPEKEAIARNVRDLLARFGGVWITPDIRHLGSQQGEPAASAQRLARLTGQPAERTLFRDEAHAQAFFEGLGFAIERHPLSEAAPLLVSPQRLRLSAEVVERAIGWRTAFVMRPRR